MKIMEDQLISFETAKLAKEKGFNIPVLYAFDDEEGYITSSYVTDVFHPLNYNTSGYKCSRPTQSLLQKWLREKHNQLVYVEHSDGWWNWVIENSKGYVEGDVTPYEFSDGLSYEEALEVGLQEALKLI